MSIQLDFCWQLMQSLAALDIRVLEPHLNTLLSCAWESSELPAVHESTAALIGTYTAARLLDRLLVVLLGMLGGRGCAHEVHRSGDRGYSQL